jgi:hypothetical protein
MSFFTLLRHLKWCSERARWGRSRRRLPAKHASRSSRRLPQLEALEDRTVLSTLTVTSAADDGSVGTLRAVLASALNGDTIRFANQLIGQTITLVQGQLVVTQSVNIAGPGAANLAISGNAASRIFDVASGAVVAISGLTLTQGLATDGAAILNSGSLTLSKDVLHGNVAQGASGGGLFGDSGGRGGAVENQPGASLEVSYCGLTGNQAIGGPNGGNAFGGGIYNEAGTAVIDRSTFTSNVAVAADGGTVGVAATLPNGSSVLLLGVAAGGGVWNDGGSVTVTSSSLNTNVDEGGSDGNDSGSAAAFSLVGTATGGAIGSGAFFTTATPSVAIAGSTLNTNRSQGGTNLQVNTSSEAGTARGGAVGLMAGDVSISTSGISGNLAVPGAVFSVFQGGTAIEALGAAAFGGGIDDQGSFGSPPPLLSITGSMISGNMALASGAGANASGGGLDTSVVNAELTNSIVSGNQAIGGPGGGFLTFYGYTFPLAGGQGAGGGILSTGGSLTISGSTVKDNLAQGGSAGGAGFGGFAFGGGIYEQDPAFVLADSTLSGNQAIAGPGAGGNGGGLFSDYGGSATIRGISLVNNLAQGGGGQYGYSGRAVGGGALVLTSLDLSESSVSDNHAVGGTGGSGIAGGSAIGGGLALAGGASAAISNSTFRHDVAQGGPGVAGDNGRPGGAGGTSLGGGLAVGSYNLATAQVSNSTFIQDMALGGAGGGGATGGPGGAAQGGAVANTNSTTTVSDSRFVQNIAQGGAGGSAGAGVSGGMGGDGQGGAFFSAFSFSTTSLTVSNSTINTNQAQGGDGSDGGNGGNGLGGGLYAGANTTVTIATALLDHNQAVGGDGNDGGNGGNGFGGGIYVAGGATVNVAAGRITHNRADGGEGDDGGGDGQGIGGGVYNLGTLTFDVTTVIAHNHASASSDDTFGV